VRSYNILVTGVGAIIGYGIVRALRRGTYRSTIIGVDANKDAVGQHWCDHFRQGLKAEDKDFPSFLTATCRDYKIDLVIPGIEQDLHRISPERHRYEAGEAKIVLNTHDLIAISQDKWRTHAFFSDKGVPQIKTFIDGEYGALRAELGSPFLVKPRRSYSSKGIFLIETEEDYAYWKHKLADDFMVQERVGDEESEFTVAIFGLGDGSYSDILVFKRKLCFGGTFHAVVYSDHELESYIARLCALTRPVGPTNVQVMKHKGEYLLLEINPRISASTSLRAAFGFNEPEMCIEYFLMGNCPNKSNARNGKAVRYIEDIVYFDSDNI
jgi:carbamoyl-phosphate synthase large subunit